jgi:hypothetical protein
MNSTIVTQVYDQPPALQLVPRLEQPFTIVHCVRPGCTFSAAGGKEWQAIHLLGLHLQAAHGWPKAPKVPTHDISGNYIYGQD